LPNALLVEVDTTGPVDLESLASAIHAVAFGR